MISIFLDFFDGAYKEKTSIKRDATSRKIMEALAKSDYYDGEVSLYEGYFVPKKKFPNNLKICLSTSKDDFYIVSNDHIHVPMRYGFGLAFLICLLFSLIPILNGIFYLAPFLFLIFWIISRVSRILLKDDVHLFLERYYKKEHEHSKSPRNPNRY
ncbi:hypothetical protein [Nonlabens sp. Asnod3-A02]|uniref:hypothetical protein n=1 Tax=Nonlabens sp. Asnod3-A02 TaxID=3160579 RepID=UPI00386EAAEE